MEPLSWKGHLLWQGTSSLQMQASHTIGREYSDRKRLLAIIPGPSPISAKGQPKGPGHVTLPCGKKLHWCLTLCHPINHSLPSSFVHGNSPSNKTGVGCHTLLQGIFPTQGSNPHVLSRMHWQVGSLPLVPPEKPHSALVLYKYGITVCAIQLQTAAEASKQVIYGGVLLKLRA